jgi:hypothetical protein
MKSRYALLLLGIGAVALAGIHRIAHQEGYLAIDAPGVTLQLQGGFGHHRTLSSGLQRTAVPARLYRPVRLDMTRTQDGDTWRMHSGGPWGELSRITVERGQTTAVELGPPLTIKPLVEVIPGQVFIGLRIFGRAGEQYSNLVYRNDRRIETPKVTILSEGGTTLAFGSFAYG